MCTRVPSQLYHAHCMHYHVGTISSLVACLLVHISIHVHAYTVTCETSGLESNVASLEEALLIDSASTKLNYMVSELATITQFVVLCV